MFQARGHFDLQFTLLLGQSLADWPTIGAGGISGDYFNQAANLIKGLLNVFSLAFYLLIIGSLIYIKGRKNLLLALVLPFLTIEFILLSPNVRHTALITPFFAMVAAIGLINIFRFITSGHKFIKIKKIIYFIVLTFIFGFELFYNLNTNTFYQPLGSSNKHYSSYRWENIGFKQLENYLVKEENFNERKKAPIKAFKDLNNDASALKGEDVYIYDPSAKWFPALWYLRRYAIYYNNEFVPMNLLDDQISAEYWKSYMVKLGVKNVYLIRAVNNLVYDHGVNTPANQRWVESVVSIFKTFNPELKEIYNSNNQLVFNVYKLRLDD